MKEVNIRQRRRKDGTITYEYRFEIASVDGVRKWATKGGFKTKTAAKEAGKAAQQQYENIGQVVKPSDMSFADFLDYWIEHDCRVDCKASTIENYEKKIRLYIKPVLGGYRLRTITKDSLQTLLVSLYNDGYAPNTISVIRGILTKSLAFAEDRHFITYSPATRLKMPKNQSPATPTRLAPHIYIPQDKMQEIFARFPEGSSSHIPLMIGYKCGLRIGEVYALQWDDIDLEKKTLAVNRQIQWHQDTERTQEQKNKANGSAEKGRGYWYFSPPKYHSYRVIDLDDELVELLKREKERQERAREYYAEHYFNYFVDDAQIVNQEGKGKPINFVTVRESGEYITLRTMQHTSNVIHKKLDCPEFDFHSLRHTHATMLQDSGVNPVYISRRLGHKNVEITENVYANHLTEQTQNAGIEIINNLYK